MDFAFPQSRIGHENPYDAMKIPPNSLTLPLILLACLMPAFALA